MRLLIGNMVINDVESDIEVLRSDNGNVEVIKPYEWKIFNIHLGIMQRLTAGELVVYNKKYAKLLEEQLEAANAEIERLNKEHVTLLENAIELRGAV